MPFNNLSHLSYPVIHDSNTLAEVILLLGDEMTRRTNLELSDMPAFEKQPYIICAIDEFSWFIDNITDKVKTEKVINILNDILRYGRHNKIHLVLSIYDPTKENAKINLSDIQRD